MGEKKRNMKMNKQRHRANNKFKSKEGGPGMHKGKTKKWNIIYYLWELLW